MQSPLIVLTTLSAFAFAACADDTVLEDTARKKPKGPPPGAVLCYSQAAPSAWCGEPDHCCFSSESQHDGTCTTDACAWGTVTCDGPEDCARGEHCCATYTSSGVTIACQANACLAAPAGDELCHEPSVCADGRWCITADGTQPALPRTLAICRG